MDPPFAAYDYATDKQPFVFVSYAHADAQQIYPIIKQLHEKGVRIWYDEGIEASSEWIAKIADAIKHCTTFLTFLSNISIRRNNVKREIFNALKRYDKDELQFIPVYLEEMTLSEDLDLVLGPIQALMKHRVTDEIFLTKLYSVLNPSLLLARVSNGRQIGASIQEVENARRIEKERLEKEEEKRRIEEIKRVEEEKKRQNKIELENAERNYQILLTTLEQQVRKEDWIEAIRCESEIIELSKKYNWVSRIAEAQHNLTQFNNSAIVDYHGQKLVKSEYDAITEIEKVTGAIPFASKIDYSTFGIIIHDNHIVGLGLCNKGLTSLPESIEYLQSLKLLDLASNKLKTLPESIGNLKSLTNLDLWKNQLIFFPESIGNLQSLRVLSLRSNQLTSLPVSFKNLTNLEELYLMENQLTSLPNSIGNLTGLHTLNVHGNQLTSLPNSIGNLTGLHTLNLGSNMLSSLPETIFTKLTSLMTLNLSGNKLTDKGHVEIIKKLTDRGCKIID